MTLSTTESGFDGETSLITQNIQINFQVLELIACNCAKTCSLPTFTFMERGMSYTDVCRAQNCAKDLFHDFNIDEELLGNDDEIGYAGWVSSDNEDND